jgi:hypothetical protein
MIRQIYRYALMQQESKVLRTEQYYIFTTVQGEGINSNKYCCSFSYIIFFQMNQWAQALNTIQIRDLKKRKKSLTKDSSASLCLEK